MTRSLRSLPLLALAAISACSAFAVDVVSDVFRIVTGACNFVVKVVRNVLRSLTHVEPVEGDRLDIRASKALTAASAFVRRMVKRDAPRVEARWRMCPSA